MIEKNINITIGRCRLCGKKTGLRYNRKYNREKKRKVCKTKRYLMYCNGSCKSIYFQLLRSQKIGKILENDFHGWVKRELDKPINVVPKNKTLDKVEKKIIFNGNRIQINFYASEFKELKLKKDDFVELSIYSLYPYQKLLLKQKLLIPNSHKKTLTKLKFDKGEVINMIVEVLYRS